MKNNWNEADAQQFIAAAQAAGETAVQGLRVYSSRLIGAVPDLVLHGGGNTSAKECVDGDMVMYIKGSGWDLATIESAGLPAVHLAPLLAAKTGKRLSDEAMVALLRAQLLDSQAPTPSVEALLHAFCPHAFVDHTHASAILVLANQENSETIMREIYGDRVAFLPYVMPGFDLSIAAGQGFDAHPDCEGMWLENHGLFTFGADAKTSYDRMIAFVSMAEDYLSSRGVALPNVEVGDAKEDTALTARLTAALAEGLPGATLHFLSTPSIRRYSQQPHLLELSRRGTVTPDHVIRIKPFPLIVQAQMDEAEIKAAIAQFAQEYTAYFARHAPHAVEEKIMLDAMPRLIMVPNVGLYGVGKDAKAAKIAADLGEQTARVVNAAEDFGAFHPIAERDLFDMEYWSLEQAKLKKA